MKQASKLILTIIFLLLLNGCTTNEPPLESLKVSRDYPEDQLPLYDDAFVIDMIESEDKIELIYGISDDTDDVQEYYIDLFGDIGLPMKESIYNDGIFFILAL